MNVRDLEGKSYGILVKCIGVFKDGCFNRQSSILHHQIYTEYPLGTWYHARYCSTQMHNKTVISVLKSSELNGKNGQQ